MGPLGLGPWLPWHPKGVVNPEVAAENRQPVVIPLVPKAHGPGEGNKRLPLYDFHRFFRLSWDNTESLVRRSCLLCRFSLVVVVDQFVPIFRTFLGQ